PLGRHELPVDEEAVLRVRRRVAALAFAHDGDAIIGPFEKGVNPRLQQNAASVVYPPRDPAGRPSSGALSLLYSCFMNRDKGREILKIEAEAVLSLAGRLGKEFDAAIDAIVGCKGHLVVTGMGKAGLVGQKISATFASTGTPSIFLPPAEAYHGDLGRVLAADVVLAISNSGETEEVARLLP